MSHVDHPTHYNQGQIECIEVIDQLNLGFSLGNALKYIWRCNDKGKKIEDLRKAVWYIEHEIAIAESIERANYVEEKTNTAFFTR
jgi:hypothetical protein